ncbi:MAG: RNase adapter RapZ [Eubacteriales bacterium]|nr:RNase adapter RapZ [Eubacteriales bacterium]
MSTDKLKVVIVTGLSGAGKTCAADWFEDHGYYVVDNMPPALIPNFLEIFGYGEEGIGKAALVVDIRSEEFFPELRTMLQVLKKDPRIDLTVLFMEASNEALIRRFSETRREHPLAKGGRTSARTIDLERSMLEDIRAMSDYILDTTNTKVAELYEEMTSVFTESAGEKKRFHIHVLSFGYKHGIAQGVDIVLDMRFLPNPFYVSSLRNLTGNNKKVQRYVLKHKEANQFMDQLDQMLALMIPHFVEQGKFHLNLAFGCTGGQHRSVAMANAMSQRLSQEGYQVTVEHRELQKKK